MHVLFFPCTRAGNSKTLALVRRLRAEPLPLKTGPFLSPKSGAVYENIPNPGGEPGRLLRTLLFFSHSVSI